MISSFLFQGSVLSFHASFRECILKFYPIKRNYCTSTWRRKTGRAILVIGNKHQQQPTWCTHDISVRKKYLPVLGFTTHLVGLKQNVTRQQCSCKSLIHYELDKGGCCSWELIKWQPLGMNPYMQVIQDITFSLAPASFQSSSLLLSRRISNSRRMVNREVSEHWKRGSVKCVLECGMRAHFFFVVLGVISPDCADGSAMCQRPTTSLSANRQWHCGQRGTYSYAGGSSLSDILDVATRIQGHVLGLPRGQRIYFLEIPRPNDKWSFKEMIHLKM